jgi:hypothetical protein
MTNIAPLLPLLMQSGLSAHARIRFAAVPDDAIVVGADSRLARLCAGQDGTP